MKRNDAIRYAKRLVKRILDMRENDEDFKCMISYEDIFEKILDAYAEYIFPEDEED